MNRLLALLVFMFAILSALPVLGVTYTVCSAGCDFSNITLGLMNASTVSDGTIAINSPGAWVIENVTNYTLNTSRTAVHINSSNVSFDCNAAWINGNGSGTLIEAGNVTNVSVHSCYLQSASRGIDIYNVSVVNLSDHWISGMLYGLWLENLTVPTIDNVTIADSGIYGISFNDVINGTVADFSVSNSSVGDVRSSGNLSYNYLLNGTFNQSSFVYQDASHLAIQWYAQVRTQFNGTNASNINVSIIDIDGRAVGFNVTDANGLTENLVVTEFIENSTLIESRSPHTFIGENTTMINASQFTLSKSLLINVSLADGGSPLVNCIGISPRPNVDWNIWAPTSCVDVAIALSTNQSVSAYQNLSLLNSSLAINASANGSAWFNVSSLLALNQSNVTGVNAHYGVSGRGQLYFWQAFISHAGYSSTYFGFTGGDSSSISESVFRDGYRGLTLNGSSTTVINSLFTNHTEDGLWIIGTNAVVNNSNFTFNDDGITLSYANGSDLRNNLFMNNTGSGIVTQYSFWAGIVENTFTDNEWSAIELTLGSHNATIDRNVMNSSVAFYAITVDNSDNVVITNHTIVGHSGDGIYIVGSDNTRIFDALVNGSGSDDIQTLTNGTTQLMNATFVTQNIGSGTQINTSWLVRGYVNDSLGDLANSTLTFVRSGTSSPVLTTGGTGFSNWSFVHESLRNSTAVVLGGNYTVEVRSPGKVGVNDNRNISMSETLSYTLVNQSGTLPDSNGFDGTDFALESNLSNVTNATVNNSYGGVRFPGAVNFSGANLSAELIIMDGMVFLNSTANPNLNQTAEITLTNVSCPVDQLYKSTSSGTRIGVVQNGVDCVDDGSCSIISCSNGVLVFNVTGFSSFATGVNANLTIWDQSDNVTVIENTSTKFFARYVNGTDPINGTNVSCVFNHNATGSLSSLLNMTYNGTSGNYEFNTTIASAANFSFNVSCDGTSLGFVVLNATDNATVSIQDVVAPVITINYPQNATNVSNSTTTLLLNISTNEAATCKYTTNGSFDFATGGVLFNSTGGLAHTANVTGLVHNTTYNYYYLCNDTVGNVQSTVVNHQFATNETPNLAPMNITSVVNSSISNVSATITWTTDKDASSLVRYGVTSGVYSLSAQNSTHTRSHSVVLSSLAPNTTYYYVVNSTDRWGVSAQSSQGNFTTSPTLDLTAPTVSFTSPSNGTTISNWRDISLSVTTNEASTCTVTSGLLGTTAQTSTVLTTTTGNLTHIRSYNATADSTGQNNFFTVSCVDASSNTKVSTINFALNDTTPPSVTFSSSSPTNGTLTNTPNVSVSFSAGGEPTGTGFPRISWGGGTNVTLSASSNTYTYNQTNLGAGSHNYTVYITDAKGNQRTIYQTFTLDLTAPDIEVLDPEDESTINDPFAMVLNISLEENATCSYFFYEDDEDGYDDCISDCAAEETSCDADDAQNATVCESERTTCDAECLIDRYDEEASGTIEEIITESECNDLCEENFDTCEDDCDGDESCEDECSEVQDECTDICEDHPFLHVQEFDEWFANGEYLFNVSCIDSAGNDGIENISVTLSDTTPPLVIDIEPNGSTERGNDIEVELELNEAGFCRYAFEDVGWDSMTGNFSKTASELEVDIEDVPEGLNYLYIICEDKENNRMTEPVVINFTYEPRNNNDDDDDDEPAPRVETVTIDVDEIPDDEPETVEIDDDDFSVQELIFDANKVIEDIELEVSRYIDQSTLSVPAEDVIYEVFEINHTGLSNKDLDEIIIKFRIAISWFSQNGVNGSSVRLKKFENGWTELNTSFVEEADGYRHYEARTSFLSLFAVTGQATAQIAPTTAPIVEQPSTVEEAEGEEDGGEEGSNLWMIIIIAVSVVVVIGGGAGGFVYYRKKKGKAQPKEGEPAEPQEAQPKEEKKKLKPLKKGKKFKNKEIKELIKSLPKDDELGHFILKEIKKRTFMPRDQALDKVKEILVGAGHEASTVESIYQQIGLIEGEAVVDEPVTEQPQEGSLELNVQDIDNYVIEALNAGTSEADITAALVENGYEEGVIAERIAAVRNAGPEPVDEVDAYIQEARGEGMKDSDIFESLVTNGYSENDIVPYFNGLPRNEDYVTEIKQYIQSSLEAGLDRTDIVQTLLESGNDPGLVEQLLGVPEDNTLQELSQYVKESMQEGKTKELLRDELISMGHDPELVEQSLGSIPDVVRAAVDDELLHYIGGNLKKGYPKEQIKNALLQAGHSNDLIERLFVEATAVLDNLDDDIGRFIKMSLNSGKTKKALEEELLSMGLAQKEINQRMKNVA